MSRVESSTTSGVQLHQLEDPSSTASLSPELLLLYCTSRLNSLDERINEYFASQQRQKKTMDHASTLSHILGTFGNGVADTKGFNAETVNKTGWLQHHARAANQLLELYCTTDNPDLKAQAASAFQVITGGKLEDFLQDGKPTPINVTDIEQAIASKKLKGASPEQWSARLDDVKNLQSSLSKNSELDMIQLQSLVSQRQLAVQLTTQLLQTLSETAKQIVGNFR